MLGKGLGKIKQSKGGEGAKVFVDGFNFPLSGQ